MNRLFKIFWILWRYRIESLIGRYTPFTFCRYLSWFNPWYFATSDLTEGQRLCRALEKLGPLAVKFGQFLSTRADLLPDTLIVALRQLQDRVTPLPAKQIFAVLTEAYNAPLPQLFKTISTRPLASASIAQVHAAQLPSGEAVVIKVLRPHIHQQIQQDIVLMKRGARWLEKISHFGKQVKLMAMVAEFESVLSQEIDLKNEARHAERMKKLCTSLKNLEIPKIYPAYTRKNVLVMERIYGIPIADLKKLQQAGVDFTQLARDILSIFLTQVFEHNYFHADLHPGNIFVNEYLPSQYIFVDFGIVGSLTEEDQRYIAENMLAFFKKDYHRVATLHRECGWIAPETSLTAFEADLRAITEPIFELSLQDISMGQLLLKLIQLAKKHHINIQPQLILIQKTLLNVESLARSLDPKTEIWQITRPYLERWLRQKMRQDFLQRLGL